MLHIMSRMSKKVAMKNKEQAKRCNYEKKIKHLG